MGNTAEVRNFKKEYEQPKPPYFHRDGLIGPGGQQRRLPTKPDDDTSQYYNIALTVKFSGDITGVQSKLEKILEKHGVRYQIGELASPPNPVIQKIYFRNIPFEQFGNLVEAVAEIEKERLPQSRAL